jgi:hypothetical protein
MLSEFDFRSPSIRRFKSESSAQARSKLLHATAVRIAICEHQATQPQATKVISSFALRFGSLLIGTLVARVRI